jgi:hypothetical protein
VTREYVFLLVSAESELWWYSFAVLTRSLVSESASGAVSLKKDICNLPSATVTMVRLVLFVRAVSSPQCG